MFTTPFLFFSVHASEEEKKKAEKKRKVRKKNYLGFDFFFECFCLFARQRTKAQRIRHILRNSIHKTHLQLTLLLKMSSAHTENLPADLNEHNEELADGCDNADTYLSAFYLFFFFLSF